MIDTEFDQLKREFLDEATAKVREIEAMLGGDSTLESVERIIYLAHQLKGAGGSYGFARISTEAAGIEDALENGSAQGSFSDDLRRRVADLSTEIAARTRELTPQTAH